MLDRHRHDAKDGVLVLGMHRSGTSVVAGTLHRLGLAVCAADDLMTGMPWNPAGHWESRSLSRLDDQLLDEMGRSWWYPPPPGPAYDDFTARLLTSPETAAGQFRRTYTSTPWVWKDPRLSLLLPFWREALGEAIPAVVVHRDPQEVARSLELRNGFPTNFGMALWIRYNRLLLEHCRGSSVLVVRYGDLVDEPEAWVRTAASFLHEHAMAGASGADPRIVDLVRPALRHFDRDRSGAEAGHGSDGRGREPAGGDLALEVERVVSVLDALEGAHSSFDPPSLGAEPPQVEARLRARWPGGPPGWNDPPWSATRSSPSRGPSTTPTESATVTPRSGAMNRRVAVLIVNGFSPRTPESTADAIRYPWIGLCLRELTRRSADADYAVHVWDNTGLPEHRELIEANDRVSVWPRRDEGSTPIPHRAALDRLVATVDDDVEYLVLLDTDAAPVADGWLGTLVEKLEDGAGIVGVWRDEMAPELPPFVHVSCLAIRRAELLALDLPFARCDGEPGQDLTGELVRRNRPVMAMRRTNARNAHFLLGGIYADTVYHHGAGSRPAWFYASADQGADERMRILLRDAAFEDFDHLVAVLRGEADNDIWSEPVDPTRSPPRRDGDQPAIDPVMVAHYTTGAELGRLETRNRLEFERTKKILEERLPAGGRVIDVGGGPGVYASWFAARGYEVDLVDPVELHVAEAERVSKSGAPFRAHLGDARRLPFADECADAVVMMGPLFHLVEQADRIRALREALRVLRPGGVVAASAMGRFFWFEHALVQNTVRNSEVRDSVVSFVDTGRRPDGEPPYPAFAHRPEELEGEMTAAGFSGVVVLAIEGFFHLLGDLEQRLADPPSAEALFELLGRYEADPAIVGLSGHLMAVGRKDALRIDGEAHGGDLRQLLGPEGVGTEPPPPSGRARRSDKLADPGES